MFTETPITYISPIHSIYMLLANSPNLHHRLHQQVAIANIHIVILYAHVCLHICCLSVQLKYINILFVKNHEIHMKVA